MLANICLFRTVANRHKVLLLFLSEQSRFRDETHAEWYFKREARTATWCDINCQVRVLPMLELPISPIRISLAPTLNSPSWKHMGDDPSQQPPL
jgi:hypothetical protein